MNKKILLINSPTMNEQSRIGRDKHLYFPYGLLSMATVMKNNNCEIRVVDINTCLDPSEVNEDSFNKFLQAGGLQEELKGFIPDIVGIGAIFSGAFKGLRMIAESIKLSFPQVHIVIGGITATMFSKEILNKYKCIDYVIIGEGEDSFLELCKIISDIVPYQKIHSLDGVAYRDNGTIKKNPKTKYIEDPNSLPYLDYSFVNVEDYEIPTEGWYTAKNLRIGLPFPILSSRSCPMRCSFCNMMLVHGPTIRFRSPENVVGEMEKLYHEHGVRYFQFMDDNLTFDKKRMIEICNLIIEKKLDIEFDTPNGVAISKLDDNVIHALVSAGLNRIALAIEHGSSYMRNKIIGKGLSNRKIYEVINKIAQYPTVHITAFFIIGMPEETEETMEETYQMIKNLPLDLAGVFFATPYPGTKLFKICMENNLLPRKEIDYYLEKSDLHHNPTKPHFLPYELDADVLCNFQKKCFHHMDKIRAASPLPNNYPLRYKGPIKGAKMPPPPVLHEEVLL